MRTAVSTIYQGFRIQDPPFQAGAGIGQQIRNRLSRKTCSMPLTESNDLPLVVVIDQAGGIRLAKSVLW
jgi:hypothetical protein